MNSNQARVLNFVRQIPHQAKNLPEPFMPTIPPYEVRLLRARLILEETIEQINALGFSLDVGEFVPCLKPDLIEIIDAVADIEVINYGTAVSCGVDMEHIYNEVMNNNDLKLTTGSIVDGKLTKAKDHPRPDIVSHLIAQGYRCE